MPPRARRVLKPGLLGRRREFLGRWQSGQSQQAVNLPPSGYGGSNPPLPTNFTPARGAKLRADRSWWGEGRAIGVAAPGFAPDIFDGLAPPKRRVSDVSEPRRRE